MLDKLLRATESLDFARDLLAPSATTTRPHRDRAERDHKRLTVIAALLLFPTFIVGVYGQNFDHMPELHWRFGYRLSWGHHHRGRRSPRSCSSAGRMADRSWRRTGATLADVPYFICPNCKQRSIDHDRLQEIDDVPVACERCGFGFLFELMDDYYPAPNAGFVVCDRDGRCSPPAAGVFELVRLPGTGPHRRGRRGAARALRLPGWAEPGRLALEWGVRRLGEKLELRTRAGQEKPVIADFFPAYDDDGGLLVALTPHG